MFDAFPQPEAKLLVFEDPRALAREAARRVVGGAGKAVEAGAMFRVALSGGTTPLETYRTLASDPYVTSVHWASVELFWSDERFVPPTHPDSNYGLAVRLWLEKARLPPERLHRMPADAPDLEAAARQIVAALRGAS